MDNPRTENLSYYDILELSPKADDYEIKRAYRRLAFQFHPDHNPHNRGLAEMRFRLLHEAYKNLSTAEKRERYHYFRSQNKLPLSTYHGAAKNDNNHASASWITRLVETLWPHAFDNKTENLKTSKQ